MDAIDREKLVTWGRERLNQLKKKNDVLITKDYVDGYIDAFEEWLGEIQSGVFDVPEPERTAIEPEYEFDNVLYEFDYVPNEEGK